MNGIKIFFKNLVAFRKSFFKSLMVNAGIALAVHEAAEWLVNSPSVSEPLATTVILGYPLSEIFTSPLIYACLVILFSMVSQVTSAKFCRKINDRSGCAMEISMNDIFKNDGQIIVPCDNLFLCDPELIGKSSIKAQMMSGLTCSKNSGSSAVEEFAEEVKRQLALPEHSDDRLEGKIQLLGGKEFQVYKYGTIVPVDVRLGKKKNRVLLLAMSEIKTPGVPSVDRSTLLSNIDKMWDYIAEHHTQYDVLVVPVMGTGAAHTSIDKQLVARYILFSFAQNAPRLGLKKMILSIYPDDYVNDEINLAELKEYAEFLCKFPSSDFSSI